MSEADLERPEINRATFLKERDKTVATQNATQNVTQNYETPNNRNLRSNRQNIVKQWCGGWDLNPRTSTGQPPQGCAFGHAWQPPLQR